MIIDDERNEVEAVEVDYENIDEILCAPMSRQQTNEFMKFNQVHQYIRDQEVHSQLQLDLIEHLQQLQAMAAPKQFFKVVIKKFKLYKV